LLFGKGDPRELSREALELLAQEVPTFQLVAGSRDTNAILDAVTSGKDALFKSKGEAKRAVDQGGVYINNERVGREPAAGTGGGAQLLHGKYVLVRRGSRNYGLVVVSAGK
jgi:tyrosyl-tRNA synthetase